MINHYTGIRVRAVGSGLLKARLISADDARENILESIPMLNQGRELFRLANFLEEKVQLEIKITNINESFSIRNITVLKTPVFTSYPG